MQLLHLDKRKEVTNIVITNVKRKRKICSVEGGVGAGKSEQVRRLKTQFGDFWNYYREPGSTVFGDLIRNAVQSLTEMEKDGYEVSPKASLFAYNSSRANLVDLQIRPDLKNGRNVLLDRYWFSTYAIQGAEGVSKPLIMLFGLVATGGLLPNLVIHYDLPAEVGIKRKEQSSDLDRYDVRGPNFHKKVRQNYQELSRLFPRIWKTIDASLPVDEVFKLTMDTLRSRNIVRD